MSSGSRRTSCQSSTNDPPNPTAQSTSNSLFNLNGFPVRRGLDLRRPIMSQPRQDVIDLTEDTSSPPHAQILPPAPRNPDVSTAANRPPRFDRNIINIDDEDDDATFARGQSPEIEFLTSRPRSRSLSATRRLARRRPAIAPVAGTPPRRPHVAIRVAQGERGPNEPAGWADALRSLRFPGPWHSNLGRGNDELVEWEAEFHPEMFQAPNINLNFLQAGFNYDQPSRPQQQQQPRLPTYDPPPPAQAGYTRSPNEDEMIVCPHCDDELGEGDDEIKKQVWVVKACGHVGIKSLHAYKCTNTSCRSTVANVQGTERSEQAREQ